MNVQIRLLRLTPVEAQLAIDPAEPTAEVRGRLLGPTCEYSTTVEIAYPIRQGRVVIPEPAWWDPESPFLYHGLIACWQGDEKLDTARLRIGLKYTSIAQGLVTHNGRLIELSSGPVEVADEATFRRLRTQGRNAVRVPAPLAEAAYEIADRIGLFVLTDAEVEVDALLHPSALKL